MGKEEVLDESAIASFQSEVPGWSVRDGWLRRKYLTPGWPHSLMLAQTIGYLAESAWHHPDLEIGYAQVVVKLQTHRVRGITRMDLDLARRIEEVVLWKPEVGSALQGFPKTWVRGE